MYKKIKRLIADGLSNRWILALLSAFGLDREKKAPQVIEINTPVEVFWLYPCQSFKNPLSLSLIREALEVLSEKQAKIFVTEEDLHQFLRFMGRRFLVFKILVGEDAIIVNDGEYFLKQGLCLQLMDVVAYRPAWQNQAPWFANPLKFSTAEATKTLL